jgi:hypothetical protein
VYVTATPEGHSEQIEDARQELEKRLRRNKGWFRLAATAPDAEIVVDLRAYRMRSERRNLSTWGVVPPTEAGQPDKTQVIEILTYHTLQAHVTLFGAERIVEATKKKNADRGRARDAVKEFASKLERICKDEYWDLMRRREARRKASQQGAEEVSSPCARPPTPRLRRATPKLAAMESVRAKAGALSRPAANGVSVGPLC